MSFRPRGRQSVAAAAQRPYVLMLLCSSVFRVSGFRTPATASAFMPSASAACLQILEKHVLQHKPAKYPPQNLAYTQVNPTFAPLDIKIPARPPTGKPARLPASGHKRSCPPPESAKLRDFFCTPQRAGIQRVTPVSREIPENFPKISSPKIWCVCQKSVPLHSQIRNEAYNTSRI